MVYDDVTTINMTTNEGMSNIFTYLNTITNYWAGRMLMIAIFVMFLFGYLKSKNDDDIIGALAVASYVTFVVGLLFWVINFLDGISFSIIVGITIVSTALLWFEKRGQ